MITAYIVFMATYRTTIKFKCKKCKVKGSAEISETDHPYSTDTCVNDVTAEFRVVNAIYPSADVYCEKCDKKVL
jgi:hypothetical protein